MPSLTILHPHAVGGSHQVLPTCDDASMDVSVVIPTYNRGDTLAASIASVACQTHRPREIIVVDDGSTDGTDALLRSIGRHVTNLRVFRQENRGANAARNLGIQMAVAPWIAFQDSDDVWLPTKLERIDAELARLDRLNEGPRVVVSRFLRLSRSLSRVQIAPRAFPVGIESATGSFYLRQPTLTSVLLAENYVSTQALVVHASALDDVGGFDESLRRFQDWDLAIRLAQVSGFLLIPDPLVLMYLKQDGLSRDGGRGIESRQVLLRKYAQFFSERPTMRAKALVDLEIRRLVMFLRRASSSRRRP